MRSVLDLWLEPPRIVILTGAGISRESGLATFRDAGGIWASARLEQVATPEAFARDPARVYHFTMPGAASSSTPRCCRTRRTRRWHGSKRCVPAKF